MGLFPVCIVESSPEGLVGLFQGLLSGQAEIPEQMRIVGEFAERLAVPAPHPLPAQRAPSDRKQSSPN